MQARTPVALWLDRILGNTAIFSICMLWFYHRLQVLPAALFLSVLLTMMICYGTVLLKKRLHGHRTVREQRASQRTAAIYALTMLPYPAALNYIKAALTQMYHLKTALEKDSMCYMTDAAQHHIAVQLQQSPQPISVNTVHAFHRARKDAYGILVSAGGAERAAQAYAANLLPPMRLIDAQDLPLPEALYNTPQAQHAKKQRRATLILHTMLRPKRALRCFLMAYLLITFYLLTNQLTALIPALALLYVALIGKETKAANEELF